ncbi:MAG: IS3 family transposase [Thermoplasmata archaeon]
MQGRDPGHGPPPRERPTEEARRRLRDRQRCAARAPRGLSGKKRRRELVKQMQDHGLSSLSRAAKMTGISRRALYYPLRPRRTLRRPDEAKARASVRRFAFRYVTYGHRRVWAMLRRDGWTINRKRVYRLMKEERLLRPAHFPRPRLPSTGALEAARPNQKWYTDLTYVDTTDRGPCPLTSILDGCTREILAWSFLPNCGAVDAIEVVQAAVAREFPRKLRADGVVLRSDAGSQFIAHVFRESMKALGVQLEAIRKKRPEDNGMIESYHGHLKMDYLWTAPPTTFVETRDLLGASLRHYNEERPHSSLNYLTPAEFAKKKMEEEA